MGHDDLERRLRAESGPRDEGYRPRALPAALPDGVGQRTPMTVARWGLLGGAVLAGIVLIAVASALRGESGVGDEPSAGSLTPSALPSVVVADAECPAGSILLRAEPWGGAAGSRGTTLSVRLVEGAVACDLATDVSARILDGDGQLLVEGGSPGTGTVRLGAGAVYELSVSWSNWCDAAPRPELRWDLRFGAADPWIHVAVEVTTPDGGVPVPPCLGEGGTHLDVTELTLAT